MSMISLSTPLKTTTAKTTSWSQYMKEKMLPLPSFTSWMASNSLSYDQNCPYIPPIITININTHLYYIPIPKSPPLAMQLPSPLSLSLYHRLLILLIPTHQPFHLFFLLIHSRANGSCLPKSMQYQIVLILKTDVQFLIHNFYYL